MRILKFVMVKDN